MTVPKWIAVVGALLFGAVLVVGVARARPVCAAEVDAGAIIVGDAGGGPAQDAVASQMRAWAGAGHRVDALAATGDNVHPCGQSDLFDAQLAEPYEALDVPMWVALGNHDVEAGFGDSQLEFLGLPRLPYVKEVDGAQFLFLDSNRLDASQTQWLESRLSEPGPAVRIVLIHHPPYSCGFNGSTDAVRRTWVPIFEKHRVAAVVAGHNHSYERFTSENGVTYVVAGGGGVQTTPVESGCRLDVTEAASSERHHFVGAQVVENEAGARLWLEAVDADGAVFDAVEIAR